MNTELSIYALESVVFSMDGWQLSGNYIKHEFWPDSRRDKYIDLEHPELQPIPSVIHAQTLCDIFKMRHPSMRIHYYPHRKIWLVMDSEKYK